MKKDIEIKLIKEKERRLNTLPEYISNFIFSMETKSTLRTQIAYIKDITLFLEFVLGEYPEYGAIGNIPCSILMELTEKDIRAFFNHITSFEKTFTLKNGRTTTQHFTNTNQGKTRKLACLRSLYQYFINNDMILTDPTRKIDFKINIKKGISNKLEKDEITLFLDTIMSDYNIENQRRLLFHQRVKFRDYVMVLLLGFTGIRVSELVQLDLNDISIEKEAMTVIRKGGDEDRIYLPSAVVKPIAEYIEERKRNVVTDSSSKNALFISQHKRRMNERTVRYMLEKYKLRSGLDIKITPHTFRRSFGMELYNKTGDIELTRDALGQKSVETTRKHYAQATEKRKRETLKAFDYNNN